MPIDSATRREIARRLVELRTRAGYASQRAFARAVGVSGGLVAQWENASKCPGRRNLTKISEITGVPIDYILGNQEVLEVAPESLLEREEEMIAIFRSLPVTAQKDLIRLFRKVLAMGRVNDKEREPA